MTTFVTICRLSAPWSPRFSQNTSVGSAGLPTWKLWPLYVTLEDGSFKHIIVANFLQHDPPIVPVKWDLAIFASVSLWKVTNNFPVKFRSAREFTVFSSYSLISSSLLLIFARYELTHLVSSAANTALSRQYSYFFYKVKNSSISYVLCTLTIPACAPAGRQFSEINFLKSSASRFFGRPLKNNVKSEGEMVSTSIYLASVFLRNCIRTKNATMKTDVTAKIHDCIELGSPEVPCAAIDPDIA